MRFDEITLRGFGPFDQELTLNLREREGTVVAVTGPNGSGKSSILELLTGALFRRMPTRGALKDFATSRDAFVEVRLQNGAPWTVRQRVDAVSGKGDAEVLDAKGQPVLASTKVREADAWIADHFPSADVLYASAFGAQGSQGFLDLDPTARKRVILTTLGHTHLEQLAKAAGERARNAKIGLDTLVARIADERERGDLEGAKARLADAREGREVAEHAVDKARKALEEATAARNAYRERAAAQAEQDAKRRELVEGLRAERSKRADLIERIKNNETLLRQADAIRKAVDDAERLQTELADIDAQRQDLDRRARDANAAASEAESLAKSARRAGSGACKTAQRLRERLADRKAMELAAGALAAREEAVVAAKKALDEAEAEVARLEALRLEGKDRRIAGLRGGLTYLAGELLGELGAPQHAERVLADDNRLAEELSNAPDAIAKAQAARGTAERDLKHADREALASRAAAETLQELNRVAAELEEAEGVAAARAGEAADLDATMTARHEEANNIRGQLANMRPRIDRLHADMREADRLARRLPKLEACEARLEELRPQHEAVVATLTRLEEELGQLTQAEPLGEEPSTTEADHDVKRAEGTLRSAEAEVAVREAEVATAKASAERVAALERDRSTAEEALADWRLLERDLGRDGVQALEADAAGPELTELANDLLHNCLGPRFSVRIETVRPKKAGKGEREGCWVTVYDAERGREDDAKTFSGGERVLVGEAVNLALTMLGVRKAGLTEPTIIRDETGAALDGERGRAYVAMLRRAAQLVGAPQVLFVAHDPALWEMADDRIDLTPDGGQEAA